MMRNRTQTSAHLTALADGRWDAALIGRLLALANVCNFKIKEKKTTHENIVAFF